MRRTGRMDEQKRKQNQNTIYPLESEVSNENRKFAVDIDSFHSLGIGVAVVFLLGNMGWVIIVVKPQLRSILLFRSFLNC